MKLSLQGFQANTSRLARPTYVGVDSRGTPATSPRFRFSEAGRMSRYVRWAHVDPGRIVHQRRIAFCNSDGYVGDKTGKLPSIGCPDSRGGPTGNRTPISRMQTGCSATKL